MLTRLWIRLTPSAYYSCVTFLVLFLIVVWNFGAANAQTYQSTYSNSAQQNQPFKQEIARILITVERAGHEPLSISDVPRVEQGDLLRIRMVDEPINGIKPDQSFWDWTLVAAFVNPSRNEVAEESVSREINFKREGWYREYLLKVPYDSQPIFFLYPKQSYRKKIKKLLARNFNDIRKIGEHTLEIAGAYAQIGIFLSELQSVIKQNPYGYGSYSPYSYGSTSKFGPDFIQNQLVERLAQSFNISLPACWSGNTAGSYGSTYPTNYGGTYGANDFVSRAQCVAKNVRIEDFELSVGRMFQQGGLLAATKLVEKYPQLAYWINVAAAAADLILKIMKKTPLKIVPTIAQTQNNSKIGNGQYNQYTTGPNQLNSQIPEKISVFAESPPTDGGFVTAFPIILHKWQSEPDPDVIGIPAPRLLESCLHAGQNLLKNTDISFDWLRDPFTRDFKLILSADNGFSKEFPLTGNLGLSGWMLILNPQDLQALPKIRMNLEAKIVALRGFNQIESEAFSVPISGGGSWEIAPESIDEFSVGGKRRVILMNTMGSCRCLKSVTYKPSFGGEFNFAANAAANPLRFSERGDEAWFELDTTYFQPGVGNLVIQTFGANQAPQTVQIQLFEAPPLINKLEVHKGDRGIIISGERIEQVIGVFINGMAAKADPASDPGQETLSKKRFVFQDPNDLILSKSVSLKLQLEGNRTYEYPESFRVAQSRPAVEANERHEIDAAFLYPPSKLNKEQIDLSKYPIAPIDTEKLSVAVKTTLTDYSFLAENISLETRIENGVVGRNVLSQPEFEVLDPYHLRINFSIDKEDRQFLGGRRIQFRINDKIRGESDWYTIAQRFVRIPQIDSVVCGKNECKITGTGIDHIGQISIDGGVTWQPPPEVQFSPDGRTFIRIEHVLNQNLLRIKLRDFPETEGFGIPR